MIKVTFQNGSGGLYWAVCEGLNMYAETETYILSSVMEDSKGMGPHVWVKTTRGWRIMAVEEV